MARLKWVREALENWARSRLMREGGSFARVNLMTAAMPRDPYADAPVPIDENGAGAMDVAVRALPSELQRTVVVYYLDPGGLRLRLAALGISDSTLYARLEQADRAIAAHFTAKADQARLERERVERLVRLQGVLRAG